MVDQMIFVGRSQEIAAFKEALGEASEQSKAVYIQADGGMGKTKLLEQYMLICQRQRIPYVELIDFYEIENHQIDGVMGRLATEISKIANQSLGESLEIKPFSRFLSIQEQILQLQMQNANPEGIALRERQAERQFVEDYNQAMNRFCKANKKVVIFFDTFEEVQERGAIKHWLLDELLPGIRNTIIAFAGRGFLEKTDLLQVLSLKNFSLEETEDFMHSRDVFLPDLSTRLVQIHELTEGNPLLLDLTADWILGNPDQDIDSLLGHTDGQKTEAEKKVFKEQLVSSILRLDLPDEYETVWYMAHIYHRFDERILAWITNSSLEQAKSIMGNLHKFPFVKYRSHSGSYQLHDKMRELVIEYVLDEIEDRNCRLRQDLSRSIIKYYDNEIQSLDGQALHLRDANILRSEQLYHYLYLDIEDGYQRFDNLFRRADQADNLPICGLLLSVAEEKSFIQKYKEEQRVFINVYRAWYIKGYGNYREAESLLLEAIGYLKDNSRLDEVINSLGYMYRQLGRYEEARRMYVNALSVNKTSTKPQQEKLKSAAMILNNLGNINRLQGAVDDAHQFSITSLMLRRQLKDKPGIANCSYILGQILREFGDNTGALRYFKEAEQIYKELGNQNGFANILRQRAYIFGHINEYDDAIRLAEESRHILEREVGAVPVDLADAYDILGRMYRDKAVFEYQQEVMFNSESNPAQAIQARDDQLLLAEDLMRKGYQIALDVGDKFKEAESILSFARLYYVRGNYPETLKYCKEGIRICEPLEYNLLMSYFQYFTGMAYYRQKEYDQAFECFGWRALYASRCRAMELGMTLDSIGTYLLNLDDPGLTRKYADYLINMWQNHPNWGLISRYPVIITFCRNLIEYS